MTSTAQLQRDADSARVGLAETLDQLRDGVAPSALSGEAIALAKGSGLSLLKGLADQARENPVPALLIGAGLAMLFTNTTGRDVARAASSTLKSATSSGLDAARAAGRTVASAAEAAKEAAAGAAERTAGSAAEAAVGLGERAGGAMAAARETVSGAVQTATGAVQSAKEGIDAGKEAIDRGRHQVDELAGQARTMAADARASVARLIEEQPILMAALVAALGAAVGAVLPLSKAERDVLSGPAARAANTGRDALSGAAEVVRREVSGADIGRKMGEIAEKVVQSVTNDVSPPART